MFSFFSPSQDNAITATDQLLRLLKVKVTQTTLKQTLREHPDYPSLLSIMDSLTKWKVENIGIQAKIKQLAEFPTPFIAHIKENKQDTFTVVQEINNGQITYYDGERSKFITTSLVEFSNIFNGTVMLADPAPLTSPQRGESSGEPEYKQKHRQERLQQMRLPLALSLAILLIILIFVNAFTKIGSQALFPALFTLLSFAGAIVTGALLWYEVDRQNPVLQKICTAGKHTNCNAIIHSKAAKLRSSVSWSEIGFIYFTGGFLSLLLSGMNVTIMALLVWLNVLALPYIFFSVYYQWRVAKQWCVLCLTVQGLLVAELAISITGSLYANPLLLFSPSQREGLGVGLIFSFFTPILIWSSIKPLWLKAREGQRNKTALLRLKHDQRIFKALLPKQKAISPEDVAGLGISLGNPTVKHKLVKVCNPYCGPCAKAHPKIEEILESNPKVSAQIIFAATDDEKDKRSWPVKHLMALYQKGDADLIKQALDDWYNAKEKSYENFAAKYPLNGEIQQQGEKLKAMSDWCKKTEISFTPTFFVSSPLPSGEAGRRLYQLPDIYSVEDLKYLLA